MPVIPCDPDLLAIKDEVAKQCNRRGKILKALELVLKTIEKSNGYKTTVETVSFDVRMWNELEEAQTPSIFIVDGVAAVKRMAGKTRIYTWIIDLFGTFKETDIFTFEEFLADIKQCLEDNTSLAGTVSKVEVNNIRTDNQLFSGKDGTHLYNMEIQAEYCQAHADR